LHYHTLGKIKVFFIFQFSMIIQVALIALIRANDIF
jgi:hypothetical protein